MTGVEALQEALLRSNAWGTCQSEGALQSSSKWQHRDGPGNAAEESCTDPMRAGTLYNKAHSTSLQLEAAQQDEHLPGSVVGSTAVMLRDAPAGIASSRGSAPGVSDGMPPWDQFCTTNTESVTISAQCDLDPSLQVKQHSSCMPIKAHSALTRGADVYLKEGVWHPQLYTAPAADFEGSQQLYLW